MCWSHGGNGPKMTRQLGARSRRDPGGEPSTGRYAAQAKAIFNEYVSFL